MRVKRRLRINTAVTALSVVVLVAVLIVTGRRVSSAIEQNKIVDTLITASFERLALRVDYIRTGSERAREQVRAKNKQVGILLNEASEKFWNPDDRQTISALIEGHKSIGKIFRMIVANRNEPGPEGRRSVLSDEVEDRLLSQLNMRAYEGVSLCVKLQDSTNEALFSALYMGGGGIALTFLLMGMANLLNSATINRIIAVRVGRLREGASAFGEGNLDHRIDIRGDDEFSGLADAFNEMASKLKGSYSDLEREIEERRQTEARLLETAAELQSANADLADSRRAAINLLEDALVARREAEEAAAGLRKSREALRESEEKLSLALRSAEMGVWRLDLIQDKRHFDDQVCRNLGIDPARFNGTADEFYAVVHAEDREQLITAMNRTIGDGSLYEVEYRAVRPDGHIRHLASRGRLARDADGQPQWVDGLVWDITERKEAEEALHKAHEELAQQVEKRTKELHEKEVLLKEVHHRVKNNLQVISSLVGLQADGSDEEAVRDVLKDVIYRVRSMALVHEKLYQSESLASIDFSGYIRSLLHYLWRAHGATAAAVALTLDLESVALPVDAAMPCGLILNELAGNALKHAFRGRSTGEVAVSLHKRKDGCLFLGVRDDGVGIPEGLDWRQTQSLGLRLVQMLAGQLKAAVEMNRHNGTEFRITFKLQETVKDGEQKHD